MSVVNVNFDTDTGVLVAKVDDQVVGDISSISIYKYENHDEDGNVIGSYYNMKFSKESEINGGTVSVSYYLTSKQPEGATSASIVDTSVPGFIGFKPSKEDVRKHINHYMSQILSSQV
jgi:hypothetical protein